MTPLYRPHRPDRYRGGTGEVSGWIRPSETEEAERVEFMLRHDTYGSEPEISGSVTSARRSTLQAAGSGTSIAHVLH